MTDQKLIGWLVVAVVVAFVAGGFLAQQSYQDSLHACYLELGRF